MSDAPCRYCGTTHGPRCPHVSAIEYHPDGTVKRVEFAQPQFNPAMWQGPKPAPEPTPPRLSYWSSPGRPFPPSTCGGIGVVDPTLIPRN